MEWQAGGMGIEIVEVDGRERGARFDAALMLTRALEAERDPDLDEMSVEGFLASLKSTDRFERRLLIAFDGDDAVGSAHLWIHHMEANDDKTEVDLAVHPDHRRRGVGSALTRRAAEESDLINRPSVTFWCQDSEATHGFFGSLGLERKMLERESRLVLTDTDPEMMQQWIDASHERAAGYQLVHWRGHTPDEHLESMATLMTAMNDAPLDDLDWEPDQWTVDMMRDFDQMFSNRGCERWTSIVLAPDGSPAALTALCIEEHRRRFAHQGDTVVIQAHRGRRIGKWIKADMWQKLRADAPYVVAIDTGNAESNDPMLAINVAMGFRPLVAWGAWQATTAHLRGELAGV